MMKQKIDSKERVPLTQHEWDFSSCPDDRIDYCWNYEFARESQSIIEDYEDARKNPIGGRKGDPRFDRYGNWHSQINIFDSEGEFDDSLYLELPPGFPKVPYLKTKHKVWESDFEIKMSAKVRDAKEFEFSAPRPAAHYFAHLYIAWHESDKRLVEDFRIWLKKNRPMKPMRRQGLAPKRAKLADLKALGAARLLRYFTVKEADIYVRGCNRPMYEKPSDWSQAKGRAKRILEKWFGVFDQ